MNDDCGYLMKTADITYIQRRDKRVADSLELDSLEAEDNLDRVVHMQVVVVHIHHQLMGELVDRTETFVEYEALPLLAARTRRLSYPSQSCVESANHPN